MDNSTNLAASAATKMATGSLMTLSEVAARLSVSPMTVHRMPLSSIRIGRNLRFDPQDVARLINDCKEKILPLDSLLARRNFPEQQLQEMETQ